MTAPRPPRRRASIRVRAALAGGLVFGLAAGLTVASWTDAEFVGTTFTAGTIDLQVKAGTAAYTNAATISATVTDVFPGATGAAYLPVLVQTTTPSVAGTVTMTHSAFTGTGLTASLRYRVIRAATCNAAAFTAAAAGDYVVGTSTLTAAPLVSAAMTPTVIGTASANSGSTISLCFEFSLLAAANANLRSTTSTPALVWGLSGSST